MFSCQKYFDSDFFLFYLLSLTICERVGKNKRYDFPFLRNTVPSDLITILKMMVDF